jgi:hypothetical protein
MVCDEVLVLCQRCGARNRLEDLGLSTIGTYNQGLHFFGLARRIAVPMMVRDASCSYWLATSVLRDND